MTIHWNKVTWYSKAFALGLFVLIPVCAFIWGADIGFLVGFGKTGERYAASISSSPALNAYYADVATWPTQTNTAGGFSVSYPLDFPSDVIVSPAPTSEWRSGSNGTMGSVYLVVVVPATLEPQTNFVDAKLTVGSSRAKTAVADCLTADAASTVPGSSTGTAVVNGISYSVFKTSDAGAGNYFDTTSYRTVHAGQCYAIEYTIHSTAIGNYPVEYGLTAFDEGKIGVVLNRIVGTVKFQ